VEKEDVHSKEALHYNAGKAAKGETMRADRVEVSWDSGKSKWLVRIVSGEEVIRRHCSAPKGADEQTLRSAAQNTVRDEGYDLDAQTVSIVR